MSNLSESTLALMKEIARAMVDPGDGVPEERLDWTIGEIRVFASRAGFKSRVAVWFAVHFVQLLGPLLVLGRFRRFTSLPHPDRSELLAKMESGRFVLLFIPLKAFICMHYYEHPAALAETGFDGKPLREDLAAGAIEGAAR